MRHLHLVEVVEAVEASVDVNLGEKNVIVHAHLAVIHNVTV